MPEIVPPRPEPSPILADALLAEADRRGWLRPPALPGVGPPIAPAPIMKLERLRSILGEARGDR